MEYNEMENRIILKRENVAELMTAKIYIVSTRHPTIKGLADYTGWDYSEARRIMNELREILSELK